MDFGVYLPGASGVEKVFTQFLGAFTGMEENLSVSEDKYPICQNCEIDGKVCVVKRGRCKKSNDCT